MTTRSHTRIALALLIGAVTSSAFAQGPPPPPPLTPLAPPPVPAGNAITTAKVDLGKALFWDEQLSSTRTVSCGSCHQPVTGGADPRSQLGEANSTNPGPDGILGTADDITGSPGVVLNNADGTYSLADFFGMATQVTGRYAPPAINAGYANALFWDGRAGEEFRDPVTNQVVLSSNAALESQAAGPPTSTAEMGHQDRDWNDVATRVAGSKPLAIADGIPSALTNWINDRNYPALFNEVFGSSEVTPSRIIMAIATYERTLVSNQAPIDAFIAGDNSALTAQQQQGLQIFTGAGRCVICHGGNRFTDDNFHYLGVRPQNDDLGRFNITGVNADRGAMKTPSLRNVSLRNEYMHNGRFGTLEEVVNFYNRGGDFNAPNKPIRPLGLDATERAALVAFLEALTDPRVANETVPFDRPTMYAAGGHLPVLDGNSVAGSGDFTPQMVAIEPPLRGNPNFSLGIAGGLGGANATLVIADSPLPTGPTIPDDGSVRLRFDVTLNGSGAGNGFSSIPVALSGDNALDGKTLHARWYVSDGSATNGLAASEAATFTIFGESAGLVPSPTNLTATDGDFGSRVDLTWSPVANADSYEIYRGLTSDLALATRIGLTTGTNFSDTEATPNQVFHYFVFAVTSTEAGPAASDTGFGSGAAPSISLTATDGSRTDGVALNWNSVAGASLYRVFRSESDDLNTATEIGSTSAISYLDGSATPLTTYFYWVKYEIDGGSQGFSESDSGSRAQAPPADPLETPKFLSATGTYSEAIYFTWTGDSNADGYEIFRGTSDVAGNASQIATITDTVFADTSAAYDQIYFYWVQAITNEGDTSSLAGPVTGYRPQPVVTPPPGGDGNTGSSGIQLPDEVAASPSETEADYSADMSGRWWGLLSDADAPDGDLKLAGCASAMVTHLRRAEIGIATVVFVYEGKRYPVRAVATPNGGLSGTFIKRDGSRTEMTFALQFVDTDAGHKLVGELNGDGHNIAVNLCQRSLNPRVDPAAFAGQYTLVLPADGESDPAVLPAGDGAFFGRVLLNGVGRFVGWLGDGTPVSFTGFSGPDQQLMFFRPVYGGAARGWIGGTLTFRDTPSVADGDGILHWVKNADDRQRRYPDGFDLQQGAVASLYERPNPRDGMPFVLDSFLDETGNGELSLNGAGLTNGLDSESIDWNQRNRFRFDSDQFRIIGRAAPNTGWFLGICVDLENGTRLPFCGVAFQKQQLITGTLRGAESTGFIAVEPTVFN
ncbi:MAG: hypothetical protein KDN19_14930 [Verrucomicrobiae bacterium]|nr:hypothetical protein [Verrucomicrobiae bacterium]